MKSRLGWKIAKPLAMALEDADENYSGPFVVLAPDPLGYRVTIEPPGDEHTRTFREKNDAWRYAQDLWTAMRCPLRDESDFAIARHLER